MFDVYQIRKDFPILSDIQRDKPLLYLDSAATSQKPQIVLDRLLQYYQEENANINRGAYDLAALATDAYEDAREEVRQFIGANRTDEIIFVRGTTEAVNLLATSFAAPRLHAGDEILISAMEHHANLVPWQMLCQRHQAQLRVIPMSDQGELDLEAFQQLLSPRTRLLALTHISNSLGTINPVKEMIKRAHEQEIPVFIDAAQSAPHQTIRVQELDCDFLAFSGHKLYGPMGIGVLYAQAKWHGQMQPYQFGGDMIRMVSFEKTSFNVPPHRFEAGTPNVAGAIGLGEAIRYMQAIGWIKFRPIPMPSRSMQRSSYNKSQVFRSSVRQRKRERSSPLLFRTFTHMMSPPYSMKRGSPSGQDTIVPCRSCNDWGFREQHEPLLGYTIPERK